MNHSTTLAAPVAEPGTRSRSFRRIAATVATAALAGGMLVAVAAPANADPAPATTTGTVTDASLTWGFSNGSKAWGIETTGDAAAVSPVAGADGTFTTASGFTLSNGTGSFSDAGLGSVDFDGSVTYSPFAAYGTMTYHSTFTFDDFELTTVSATEGTLTADVTWQKEASSLTEPKRATLATFDINTLTVDDGTLTLETAAPDWTNTVEAGKYSGTFTDAWPTSLVDALLPLAGPSDFPVYFYRTGNTAGNTNKAPLPISATADLVTPTVDVVSNTASAAKGLELEVAGNGFRAVTKPGDAGIYIAVAPAGGITDYSSANMGSFVGTQWLNATVIASGAFSTTLKVKQSELDPTKSYSIYTWQSHTHSNESQDTETPIEINYADFKNTETTLALASATSVYGKSVTATATVPGATAGDVRFYSGETLLGTAALSEAGVATFALRSTLTVGAKTIHALFVGTESLNASSSNNETLTVAKAATSKVTISGKAFKKSTKPTVTITIAKLNNGNYASGSVKLYKNGAYYQTVKITTAKKGKVTVSLRTKQTAAFKIKATLVASSTVAAKSSTTVSVKIKK